MNNPPVDDLMQEFLAEAVAQLDALDANRMRLRKDTRDPVYVKALLELAHTTKGACGFLPLPRLENVASVFAVVVDDIHAGNIIPRTGAMMLIMGVLDRFRAIIDAVDENGVEPAGDDTVLLRGLEMILQRSANRAAEKPQAPPPLAPAPAAAPTAAAAAPTAAPAASFALYRLGDGLKAIDLAHVEWLDLIETLVADDHGGGHGGGIVVASHEEAVNLAPHGDVASRNPSGPWPLIVLGMNGQRIGLIVDEVIDIVERLSPDTEVIDPGTFFAPPSA